MNGDDPLKLALERRLMHLDDEERELRMAIRTQRRRLADVRRRREQLRRVYVEEYGDLPDEAQLLRDEGAPYGPLGWRDAIAEVFRAAGQPLHRNELWDGLAKGGFETDAQDPKRALGAVLARLTADGVLRPRGGGIYELKEEP